jgi:hypothetical protein
MPAAAASACTAGSELADMPTIGRRAADDDDIDADGADDGADAGDADDADGADDADEADDADDAEDTATESSDDDDAGRARGFAVSVAVCVEASASARLRPSSAVSAARYRRTISNPSITWAPKQESIRVRVATNDKRTRRLQRIVGQFETCNARHARFRIPRLTRVVVNYILIFES